VLIPMVRPYRSSRKPWELFQTLYAQDTHAFFLDSHSYQPPNQAFSYLGSRPFLKLTVRQDKIYLERESGRRVLPASGLLKLLRQLFKRYQSTASPRRPFFTGGAVGYWGYELAGFFEKIRFRKKTDPGLPLLALGFYRDMMVYDHARRHYWLVTHVAARRKLPLRDLKRLAEPAWCRLELSIDKKAEDGPALRVKSRRDRFHLKNFRPEITKGRFMHMVRRAKDYIRAGDIYQANLSQRFAFGYRGSPLMLYDRLRTINPSPFSSLLKFGDLHLVSSSPERLVLKQGRLCETQPIAGTRPRREHAKNERMLLAELKHNEKERAEHIMLVDLERNDLGRVCLWPTVRVRQMMQVEKYSHVMHLVSRITGHMQKNKDALDLIGAMFPGGTITGCPKIRCMEIIDELEPVRRGVYTGSIGYLGFNGDLDLNIVIRTLVLNKQRGYLQVGAGIVHDSDPAREYEETLHKGEALTEALVQASTALRLSRRDYHVQHRVPAKSKRTRCSL